MSYTDRYIDDFREQLQDTFKDIWEKGFEAGEEAGIDYAMEGPETHFRILPSTKFELWHMFTDKQQVVSYQDMLDAELSYFANRRPNGSVVYLSDGKPQIEMLAKNLMKMAKEFKDTVDNIEWMEAE